MSELVHINQDGLTDKPSRVRRVVSFVGSSAESLGIKRDRLSPQQEQLFRSHVGRIALVGGAQQLDNDMHASIHQTADSISQSGMYDESEQVGVGVLWPRRNPNVNANQRMYGAADYMARVLRDEYGIPTETVIRPGFATQDSGSEKMRSLQGLYNLVGRYEMLAASRLPDKASYPGSLGFVAIVNDIHAQRVFEGYPRQSNGNAAVLDRVDASGDVRWKRLGYTKIDIPMHD